MKENLKLIFGANDEKTSKGRAKVIKKAKKAKGQKKHDAIILSDSDDDLVGHAKHRKGKKRNAVIDDLEEDTQAPEAFKPLPRRIESSSGDEGRLQTACIEQFLVRKSPPEKTMVEASKVKQVSVSEFFSSAAQKNPIKQKKKRIFMEDIEMDKEPSLKQELEHTPPPADDFMMKNSQEAELPTISTPSKKKWYPGKQSEAPPNLGMKTLPIGAPMCLDKLRFVITGTLDSLQREDAEDLIKKYGGRVTSAVSGKTDYLLAGTDAGTSKMGKAQKLGTKVIDEDALFEMIEKSRPKDVPIVKEDPSTPVLKVISSPAKPKSSHVTTDLLWVDKYKPQSMDQIIGNNTLVKKLSEYLNRWAPSKDKKELAVLLSGPPGIGKSTAANVVANHLGYQIVEFNASDTRNASSLKDKVSMVTNNQIMGNSKGKGNRKMQILLMDEVDGMSSGDRGGMAELIKLIKSSKVPIICVCNDRSSPKVRNLANYCLDLRFRRPTSTQIANALSPLLKAEHIDIERPALEKLINSTRNDIRQVIHTLQFWNTNQDSFAFDDISRKLDSCSKDMDLGPFDVVMDFFKAPNIQNLKWIEERLRNYFVDSGLVPLMVFEKYMESGMHTPPESLEGFALAADTISQSDVLDSHIRSVQSFSLMPMHGMLSCVLPGCFVAGYGGRGGPQFPSWFGKNSSSTKNHRLLGDLKMHMAKRAQTSGKVILMEYLDMLTRNVMMPVYRDGKEGCQQVIDFMIQYGLTLDDRQAILDFYQSFGNIIPSLPSAVKSALTRSYNASQHAIHASKKKKMLSENDEMTVLKEEDDDSLALKSEKDEDKVEDEDLADDVLIVKKKRKAPKTSSSKPKKSKKK